jgi:protein-L-isoaspartate(D-aspartate) O-methyltransferase
MSTIEAREQMVEVHLARRGIRDPRLLQAFREVPREMFVRPALAEYAYEDAPLPIEEGQTISQPYVVAAMVAALDLRGSERVLEVGTGSGYAAAILSLLASEVITIERHAALADRARELLSRLGRTNVTVLVGDGTLGARTHGPYDAIVVAAAGPHVPEALLDQLGPGARIVVPVGATLEDQSLVRLTREGSSFRSDSLGGVRFVPWIGEQPDRTRVVPAGAESAVRALVRESAEPIASIDDDTLEPLLDRIGDARLVMLGGATCGSSEHQRMRTRITRALIERRSFDFVATDADWTEARRFDDRAMGHDGPRQTPPTRLPLWMWRNEETVALIEWLRARNLALDDPSRRARWYGLDRYCTFASVATMLDQIDAVDASVGHAARARYGLLTPWQRDPAAYDRAALGERYAREEHAIVATLCESLRLLSGADEDAIDASTLASAEHYYRAVYRGCAASWNLRGAQMFTTLEKLLEHHGPSSRAVVWLDGAQVGDARATELHARGAQSVGELARARYDRAAYLVGFGTDHGAVLAASEWDAPAERMSLRSGRAASYERLFHECGPSAFLLHLREPRRRAIRDELAVPRLQRAIGPVYRSDCERQSHYFQSVLPMQFDEYVWIDETRAITPLGA